MLFAEKAHYPGDHDSAGIPMLNYRGRIGLQYNPIAIAQWGLGNYNHFCQGQCDEPRKKFLAASDWLCAHLELNSLGSWVWNHYFDWEYRSPLKAPWYSALAQGQGISLLVRAYRETGAAAYLEAAERAFTSFLKSTREGGVTFTDARGNLWFEEYIVSPPTHILNGFIWAAWGVYDYFLRDRRTAPHGSCSRRPCLPFAQILIVTISVSGRCTSNQARCSPWSPAPSTTDCMLYSCASCIVSPGMKYSPATPINGKPMRAALPSAPVLSATRARSSLAITRNS